MEVGGLHQGLAFHLSFMLVTVSLRTPRDCALMSTKIANQAGAYQNRLGGKLRACTLVQ